MRYLALLLIGFLPSLGQASDVSDAYAKSYLVQEYMELSGVKSTHADLARIVLDGFDSAQAISGVPVNKLPAAKRTEIKRIRNLIHIIFSADVFNKGVENYLLNNVDEEQLVKANKVLKQTLVKKVILIEKTMGRKLTANAVKAYYITLGINPPSKERIAYVDYLDKISGASQYSSYLKQYIISLFLGQSLSPQDVAKIDKSSKDELTLNMLYMYKGLKDEEIKGYLEALTDENIAWIVRQTTKAHAVVASRAFDRLVQEIEQGPDSPQGIQIPAQM